MAAPSESEIQTQIANAVRILNELKKYAGTHTAAGSGINVDESYITSEDTLVQSLEGEYVDQITAGLFSFRSDINSALLRGPELLTPLFREYARVIDAPETDIQGIFDRLYQYFIDNAKRVTTRGITFGAVTASGSPNGNGTINRLTVDENTYALENATADIKTIQCVQDENSGAIKHEEVFEIRGQEAERDALRITGSGKVGRLTAISARRSLDYISNPSFESFVVSPPVATTDITGWTVDTVVGAVANLTFDATNYYRDYQGITTPQSLKFSGNGRIYQAVTNQNANFRPNTPYYVQLAFNRSIGSGDGTLTLRFGNQFKSVALSAQSGWTVLRIDVGRGNWFNSFDKVPSFNIEIELNGRTTGTVLVDDVLVAPYEYFDGLYYAVVGGSTKFKYRDKFTFTDSVTASSEGIIQQWLVRAFGRYLPSSSAGSSITMADPT